MAEPSNGMRATEEFVGEKIVLKGGNHRVWNSGNTQHLKYLKLYKHVERTTIRPPRARVVS